MLSYLRITKDLSGSYSLPVSSIAFFILVLLPISMIYSTTIAIQWIGVSIRLIEISSLFSDRILSCYDYACPMKLLTEAVVALSSRFRSICGLSPIANFNSKIIVVDRHALLGMHVLYTHVRTLTYAPTSSDVL